MDIVIIPCWRRPAYLLACLKRIELAFNYNKNHFLFSIDRGFDPQILEVINNFKGEKSIRFVDHQFKGNTYNLLTAYKTALELSKELKSKLIHLIEEDIFISKQYFNWHNNVHEKEEKAVFVSACNNQNLFTSTSHEKIGSYYKHCSFQSLGVSFKINYLRELSANFIEDYFMNMEEYCLSRFPTKKLNHKNGFEQDTLIHRIIINQNLIGMYPHRALAYHAGIEGYNRNTKLIMPNTSVLEQSNWILNLTAEEMNLGSEKLIYEKVDLNFDAKIDPIEIPLTLSQKIRSNISRNKSLLMESYLNFKHKVKTFFIE